MKYFKLQIPTSIIRDYTFKPIVFAVYLKLIQLYYQYGNHEILEFHHKIIMDDLQIKDNRSFKAALDELYNRGYILTEIKKLPINKALTIHLNINVLPQYTKANFTQLPFVVVERNIMQVIGQNGLRLLYYYYSYINNKDTKRQFCFTSLQTISLETGLSKATIIKFNDILEKNRFIKIEDHILSTNNEYITKNKKEVLYFTKYNNHYFVNVENIISYYKKKIL